MSNARVREKFIKGVDKVYRKMFSDVVRYVPLAEYVKDELYGEYETKIFGEPILLTVKVILNPDFDSIEAKEQRYDAQFNITYKSLRDKGINVEDHENHKNLRRGYIEYQGVDYEIALIKPATFIADAFCVYEFFCIERKKPRVNVND